MSQSRLLVALMAPAGLVLATASWTPAPAGIELPLLDPAPSARPALDPVTPATAPAVRLVVTPTGNEARYRIQERLAGMDLPYDAVGRTGGVTGEILIGADGKVVAQQSLIVVDVTPLKSDKDRRDGYVQKNLLETAKYPTVELVPTSFRGLSGELPTTGSRTFELVGNLTIRGVTRSTTWRVTANFEGEKVKGTAYTIFTFDDFGIPQPRVPIVLSLDDKIRLEYDFEFKREIVGGATVH